MYLLDRDSLVYFFKGEGNISYNLFSQEPQNIFVPSLVVYELEIGIAKASKPSKRVKQFEQLLEHIEVLDFTQKEAKESAKIKTNLEKLGTPIGSLDTLIAGCAIANNLTLVTRNLKEFKRVPNLKLENWY